MAYRVTTIRTNGEIDTETMEDKPSLEDLQARVGGFIERVPRQPHDVWCCEDSRMRGDPINVAACERLGDVVGTVDGRLRGDIVIVEPLQ